MTRLKHKQDHVHFAQAAGHHAVHAAIQGIGVLGLKTGSVDEDELCLVLGEDAGDAVARGLRLARSDADFLPDQMVEQCGFAHIGASDDGDKTAMESLGFGHEFSLIR